MTLDDYRRCLAMARRHARSAADAADLLQEALLAGVRAGRLDFAGGAERAWLAGTLRNLAASAARTGSRRRRRESAWAAAVDRDGPEEALPDAGTPRALLARLPHGARRVAVLALVGLGAEEARYVLGLRPPAFRQRVAALRRALGGLPPALRQEALGLAYSRSRGSGPVRPDFGLIRRALIHHLRAADGIGTHDPDGHLLAIRGR